MKKSVSSSVAFNRHAVSLLGVMFCLAVFGCVALRGKAQKQGVASDAAVRAEWAALWAAAQAHGADSATILTPGAARLSPLSLLPGVTASTTMGSGFGTNIQNTVNGVGLSALTLNATHAPTIPNNSWVSSGTLVGTINFNLNGTYFLNGFSFWNQNDGGPGASGSTGIKDVTVLTSTDGVIYTPVPGGPTQFTRVTSSPASPQVISLAPLSAAFVRFVVASNWGDLSQTGFAEVQFDGNAVPSGPPSNVRVVDTVVTPGQIVAVPIVMDSQGTEKSVSFSVNYDTNPFANNPTASCGSSAPGCTITFNNSTPGRIGVTVMSASVFNAGLREVALVNFQSLPTGLASTPLTFGDLPTVRRVADANNNSLQSTFTGGRVVFAQGIEGDIAPRKTGNGVVDAGDVTVERLFITGSATPDPAFNETQRADVSPANSGGDGQLDATDLTKLRRYATGLDTPQAANGPNSLPQAPLSTRPDPVDANAAASGRAMRIVSTDAAPGNKATIFVDLDSLGDEVGTSFTLNFDAGILGNPVVELGDRASGDTVLSTNASRAAEGKIAVLIDSSKAIGINRLAKVTFDVSPAAKAGASAISFSSALARRSISDVDSNQLSSVFENGAVNISGPSAGVFSISGRVLSPDGRGVRNAAVTIVDRSGNARTATTSSFGYYSFAEVAAGSSYTVSVASRQFRFASRTVQVADNVSDLDFVGLE